MPTDPANQLAIRRRRQAAPRGGTLQVEVTPAPAEGELTEAARRFIDYLILQAVAAWTDSPASE